jgi:threonyl-tRNA synthetase
MLCRLYALVFPSEAELQSYLALREEAKRRDHRKLGEQLELFFFHPSAPGMPYWLPKGVVLKNKLIEFWREYHRKAGYQEIQSPILNKRSLWETSGHWRFYHEDMFRCETGGEEFALKPMNCANAMVVFQFKPRSYRDLPLRLSDTDVLHRNERTGSLSGLFRARCFCQDDSHNFVSSETIQAEIESILQIVRDFYSIFGLLENIHLYLSTRPDDFMGDSESWERAESELRAVLAASGIPFGIKEKDGAFYGPKIDIHLQDSLNREWQCGTIQLDFQLPRNFGLEYTDRDGSRQVPIVIHRVIYGSLERFIGIVIEHFAGRLPFWIAPLQLRVLPVRRGESPYLDEITESLRSVFLDRPLLHNQLRFDIDNREESLARRVRDAELEKIPVLLIFGPRDEANRTVVVRAQAEEQIVGLSELPGVLLGLCIPNRDTA